jgi:hypothetical protein
MYSRSQVIHRRQFVVSTVAGAIGLSMARLFGQGKTITPDLAALADAGSLKWSNRTAQRLIDGSRAGVRVNAAPGEGIAYLPDIDLADGTIAFDVRGKDVAQQSFVGVAFHGAGAASDAVYFRPFNFKAGDPLGRSHSVQYHSMPNFGWQKLRTYSPLKYENTVNPVPDPNGWFHARVVIASPKVSVFVNDATAPSLVVDLLNDRKKGMVGLWVGNNSGGDFANLTITPAP